MPQANNTTSRTKSIVILPALLADYMSDPTKVTQMRQNVRSWFLHNLDGWEERPGTDLATQSEHFAMIDDFLSVLATASAE